MIFPAIPLLLRKQILAVLLAASCIVVFLLLVLHPGQRHAPLQSFSQADSLIVTELTRFHIGQDRVRTFEYLVTEGFTRKRYVVSIPPGLSQTHLHAELNQKLRNHRVDTVAFVNVPEREMKVLILFNSKIIRTIELRTETGRS
jgi:hypothetical protein